MVVPASQWYKCDLQVATPGWKFKQNPASDSPAKRAAFCDTYMAQLNERGIQVIALADHHSATWYEDMRSAGERAGITVFPGVEVTTGTGTDGVHLVLIGDLSKSERDVENLLATVCGFNDGDHPRFDPNTGDPVAAPRSIIDILDKLGEGWFVLAAHALTENGIAATTNGSIRWKALHHDRLGAIDPGYRSKEKGKAGFNQLLRSRQLDQFPGLERLAFISTSDGYSLDEIGTRFTWIRMAEPSFEGLRQAALDHEARIICDWDERLLALKGKDPNNVTHAWIEHVRIDGKIGNSATPIDVPLDPRLNVIIGGRGSGKSTVIAGIRHLYGNTADLPEAIRNEAMRFSTQVLSRAVISSSHRLAHSGDRQEAQWTETDSARTERGGQWTRTAFPVRVFSQKELFELTANTRDDPNAASRYLLKLIDAELRLEESTTQYPAGLSAARKDAVDMCVAAVAERQAVERAARRLPETEAKRSELKGQVEAFGDPDAQAEREAKERTIRAQNKIADQTRRLKSALEAILVDLQARLGTANTDTQAGAAPQASLVHIARLDRIRATALERTRTTLQTSLDELAQAQEEQGDGAWAAEVREADAAILTFQGSLAALGVDAGQYLALREELFSTEQTISSLILQVHELGAKRSAEEAAWEHLDRLHTEVRSLRENLLARIGTASGTLRFTTKAHANVSRWTEAVRNVLSLREGSFMDDVPQVGQWLWAEQAEPEENLRRLRAWRRALADNDFDQLRGESICRADWWARLNRADQVVRVRLATLVADDAVDMYFLREGGKADNASDWQLVSTGSPGQRTAAMLGFVLNHGDEPLVLDQPEDDLDAALITSLIVREVRRIRWNRQVVIVTHNANIPVNGDAESVIVMANDGHRIGVKTSHHSADNSTRASHIGPIEVDRVREDIQEILEGGRAAFKARERRYQNDLSTYHEAQERMKRQSSDGRR